MRTYRKLLKEICRLDRKRRAERGKARESEALGDALVNTCNGLRAEIAAMKAAQQEAERAHLSLVNILEKSRDEWKARADAAAKATLKAEAEFSEEQCEHEATRVKAAEEHEQAEDSIASLKSYAEKVCKIANERTEQAESRLEKAVGLLREVAGPAMPSLDLYLKGKCSEEFYKRASTLLAECAEPASTPDPQADAKPAVTFGEDDLPMGLTRVSRCGRLLVFHSISGFRVWCGCCGAERGPCCVRWSDVSAWATDHARTCEKCQPPQAEPAPQAASPPLVEFPPEPEGGLSCGESVVSGSYTIRRGKDEGRVYARYRKPDRIPVLLGHWEYSSATYPLAVAACQEHAAAQKGAAT